MLTALALIALQSVGVVPGPLPRAEAQRRVTERFADFDVNEDGVIERDEARALFDVEAGADAAFAAAQKAKKAATARATVEGYQGDWAKADAWFAGTDADGDGKVTRVELARAMGADREQLPPR
jgi:hypothetical protein